MKIAIPKISPKKSDSTATDTNANQKVLNKESNDSKGSVGDRKTMQNMMSQKQRQDSTSNSSCCSACTESDDDSDSSSLCSKNKHTSKSIKHNTNSKHAKNGSTMRRSVDKRTVNQKKVNDSSDSSDSSDESSDSEPIKKHSPHTKSSKATYKSDFFLGTTVNQNQNLNVDGASSSDMELPDLVSAAIQRVESGSDEEHTKIEPNNKTQYTSSLLRDFVAKTQMMGSSITNSNHNATPKNDPKHSIDGKSTTKVESLDNNDMVVKRKRGRPRKNPLPNTTQTANVHNGSPDSGITSTPQSPVPSNKSASIKTNKKSSSGVAKKFDISTLEKSIYATERVLYPPRRKRQSTPQPQSEDIHSKSRDNQNTEKVDPVWRKIDINKKFRRPSECGYRSDTNTICSKVLAAQSGYTSDYCNVNRRLFSGYKSDYSCKSRRSGYKSDYSVKAKSCGYRSDCSTRFRRKIRRKRRTKMATSKPTISDQDILMIASLSLGNSDESSLDSTDKPQIASQSHSSHSKTAPRNNSISHIATKKPPQSATTKVSAPKSLLGDDVLSNSSDRTLKHRSSSSNFESFMLSMNGPLRTITSSIYKDGDSSSLKLDRIKPELIRRRRSSAVSHCSSHCSTISRHPFRRRRRRRLKSTNDQFNESNLAKMNQQIESLTSSFTSMCSIFAEKPTRDKEKSSQTAKTTSSRRANKKRKTNQENTDVPTVNSTATSKRRNKKTVQTKSPDDHKLPLKKRHYLLTPGEKSDSVNADEKDKEQTDVDTSGKAITPKKRHLLQTPVDLNDVVDSTDATSNSTCKDLQEIQASMSASITGDAATAKNATQSKKGEQTRKKSRVENVVAKTSPNTQMNAESNAKSTSTSKTTVQRSKTALTTKAAAKSVSTKSSQPVVTVQPKSKQISIVNSTQPLEANSNAKPTNARSNARNTKTVVPTPPPGIFEPSIDLELQIPFTEIPIPPITQKSNAEAAHAKSSKNNASKSVDVIDKLLHRTGAASKIGKKKRKKPNRTGFPTLKKKKKPIVVKLSETTTVSENSPKMFSSEPKIILDCVDDLILQKLKGACDRVPSIGEATGKFIERNSKTIVSTTSVERLLSKEKGKSAAKKLRTPSKVPNKQTETHHNEVDEKKEVADSKPSVKKSNQKELDSRKKIKEIRIEIEPLPTLLPKTVTSQATALRRGRPPKETIQKDIVDDVPPTKSRKVTKTATSSKESSINSESVAEKPLERNAKVKSGKKDVEISNREQKVQTPNDNIKKSTESVKLDKGVKRTVNGRIISPANRKLSSPIDTPKVETDDVKGRKKSRHEIVEESKTSSHKRIQSPSNHRENSVVDKKRARIEKIEPIKSPSTKDKAHKKQKVLKETVTDINDIVPVDEWVRPMDQEPLPQEENIHFNEVANGELVQISDTKKSNTKPKKKYLVAGLFSNYYKTDVLLPMEKSSKQSSAHDKKSHDDEPPIESLLPMPFFDKYLLQTQIDFCLPYDLWYANENDKLSGRNVVHSWNFKKIRTNIYSDSVKPIQSPDLPQCSCKPEYECGDNCLNRLVYTECSPETCPCGDKCRNTKIQKHIVAPVERFMTQNKGWGVKTNQIIKKGTYILEYVGEVVNEREFKERMGTLYIDDIHHYCLHLDGGLVIDGHRMGSDCRFVNHSCEPNCEMQKWSVNGLSRMALFAMRNIQPGEELTYDYNFSLFNPHEGQVCKCESKNCRGVIGGKSQRVRPIENKVCSHCSIYVSKLLFLFLN